MAASEKKDTLYVDVDDEITSIIEKVRGSSGKVVALVLPKRASVLQSVVNMKLLKRAAETAQKHLVLVTTEAGLLPLAGNVGLHVAATPTSKPVIPPAPESPSDEPEDADEPLSVVDGSSDDDDSESFDKAAAAATSVGELASATAASKLSEADIDDDIDMSDTQLEDSAALSKKNKQKKSNGSKLKVPNFDSFRKKLLIGGAILVLLIIAGIFAFAVLPKATITIHTDTTAIKTNLTLNLDTSVKALDMINKTVPATAQALSKSYTQQTPATGQQNNGTKANGTVKFTAQKCSGSGNPDSIATGTGVSNSGQTYITQESASFNITGFNAPCANYTSNPVDIIAQAGGTKYNTASGVTFTVSGHSDATGSGTAGNGTDNITKIVSQSDIDGAKAKLTAQDATTIKAGLEASLQGKNLEPITPTFLAGDPAVTTSANAGDTADTVTVTEVINYTMLGLNPADLKALVDKNVTAQLDKGKQVILDDGVSKATFGQQNAANATATTAVVAVQVSSLAGPQIDVTAIKSQIAGKKSGDIQSFIKQTPGVTDVTVKFSPFWVGSTPSNAKKVTVIVDKANTGNQ